MCCQGPLGLGRPQVRAQDLGRTGAIFAVFATIVLFVKEKTQGRTALREMKRSEERRQERKRLRRQASDEDGDSDSSTWSSWSIW